MTLNRKLRVLVVDDSLFFQEILTRYLEKDPIIEVVGKASNPFEARDLLMKHQPDVMTCDIEMPKMSGIAFLSQLIPQYPIPTIVISSVNEAVFDAINGGAVDFIVKPNVHSMSDMEAFSGELIKKVKASQFSKVKPPEVQASQVFHQENVKQGKVELIAVGASTGGTEALERFLKGMTRPIPGMVIVQHIPPVFSTMFAERLNKATPFTVKEAVSGEEIKKGTIFIAPGDKHMRVKKVGMSYKVECFEGEKVNGHCPSVDVLFESVAQQVGQNAVGIILTGMGYDGAKGLLAMKQKGATTLGQDEATSVVYGMPKAAYEIGAVDRQYALTDLPKAVSAMI